MERFEKLHSFFNEIKSIGFWQRLLQWKRIKILSYDAYEEFIRTQKKLDEIAEKDNTISLLQNDNDNFKNNQVKQESRITNLEKAIVQLTEDNSDLKNEIIKYEQTKESRSNEYEKNVDRLNAIKEGVEKDRARINDERVKEKEEYFNKMKKTWSEHEDNVRYKIQSICKEYLINYIDKVPFKGSPDNTVEICDEFIIFDAKSPASDDLNNFPAYIKNQTEQVKKYINQENVKKDIFLVIPNNTVEVIKNFSYNMGDYNVFVVTMDSLEPIILSLKKIEEYEFAEQLKPEERDNICRIIGKFAHTTKRRIQIDQFFSAQFLELLAKCKNDLPEDILGVVIEYEKAEKLNPPTEKRAKQILTKDLEKKNEVINSEAGIKKIQIPKSFDDVKKLE